MVDFGSEKKKWISKLENENVSFYLDQCKCCKAFEQTVYHPSVRDITGGGKSQNRSFAEEIRAKTFTMQQLHHNRQHPSTTLLPGIL